MLNNNYLLLTADLHNSSDWVEIVLREIDFMGDGPSVPDAIKDLEHNIINSIVFNLDDNDMPFKGIDYIDDQIQIIDSPTADMISLSLPSSILAIFEKEFECQIDGIKVQLPSNL